MKYPHPSHITAEHIGVTFAKDQVTLQDISFDLAAGSFTSLVGPSGCGKSTLIRCLAGLHPPTTGRLRFRTYDQQPLKQAYVFQDANLLPWRTVRQNVSLPLELAGQPRATREKTAAEALRIAGLTQGDCDKRPGMLSGGMRMRASLARALVTEPNVMLLDEPFAAIDDISRQQLNDELSRLWLKQRWTSIFITHNVAEAIYLSERVLVMSQRPGRIVADIVIPFTYPRSTELRATAEFAFMTGLISDHLRAAAGLT